MNKRLLAFGDSVCSYAWPMWPEILGQNFEEFVNFGAPGCGNFYIYHQFLLAHISNVIKKTDTVIIQWTEPSRHDYIRNKNWIYNGSESAELFLNSNLSYMNSDETTVYKTLGYMVAVVNILEVIGCNWLFMFLNDYATVYKPQEKSPLELDNCTRGKLNAFKNFLLQFQEKHFVDNITIEPFLRNIPTHKSIVYEKKQKIEFDDRHPTPINTYNYIKANLDKLPVIDDYKTKQYVNFCMSILGNSPYMLREIADNYELQINKTEFINATKINLCT